jgi:hypothetical protein
MSQQSPAIVQLAERVLVEIEEVVRGFPRYHKYAIGTELRGRARTVAQASCRAWRDIDRRSERLRELDIAIDNLKLDLQTAQRLHAFKSFAQFESIARNVSTLGRQFGAWQRQHLKSQSRQASEVAGRAQILSARDASQGASL